MISYRRQILDRMLEAEAVALRGTVLDLGGKRDSPRIEPSTRPSGCCREVLSALRPGGRFIFSIPFVYPVHADPHDFWRFTNQGIRELCAGFEVERIEPMGAWLGAVGMLTDIGAGAVSGSLLRTLIRRAVRFCARILCRLDARGVGIPGGERFTTGYFCVAVKR